MSPHVTDLLSHRRPPIVLISESERRKLLLQATIVRRLEAVDSVQLVLWVVISGLPKQNFNQTPKPK